jgi:DNA-binding NarL/FixJ family response regulator
MARLVPIVRIFPMAAGSDFEPTGHPIANASMNPKNSGTIRIVLADDHQVVRQGVRALLKDFLEFEVVGEAGDGMQAVEVVEKLQPDVLVVDLGIPRQHGLDVISHVRRHSPKTATLVLSTFSDEPFIREALRNGAKGYMLKESDMEELAAGIRSVANGVTFLGSGIKNFSPGKPVEKGSDDDLLQRLTARERVVLQMIAEGATAQEVAKKLFISPRTAETHRSNLMRKLGINTQTDLVRLAIRKGIIHP